MQVEHSSGQPPELHRPSSVGGCWGSRSMFVLIVGKVTDLSEQFLQSAMLFTVLPLPLSVQWWSPRLWVRPLWRPTSLIGMCHESVACVATKPPASTSTPWPVRAARAFSGTTIHDINARLYRHKRRHSVCALSSQQKKKRAQMCWWEMMPVDRVTDMYILAYKHKFHI